MEKGAWPCVCVRVGVLECVRVYACVVLEGAWMYQYILELDVGVDAAVN